MTKKAKHSFTIGTVPGEVVTKVIEIAQGAAGPRGQQGPRCVVG